MVIGYTSGVFDLFHIGHVNLLRHAKSMCDRLVVGVGVDELIAYKGKKLVIPFDERIEVVRSCSYVDLAIPQDSMNKIDAWNRYKFDLMFVGDDWYQTEKWSEFVDAFLIKGVRIIYFPYTNSTSSSLINSTLNSLRSRNE
jgi:glycerol-3-phosphate cytidylyltransferase